MEKNQLLLLNKNSEKKSIQTSQIHIEQWPLGQSQFPKNTVLDIFQTAP